MAQLNPDFHAEIKDRIAKARDAIKIVETVQKLQAFVLDEKVDGQLVCMSKEQLKAAEILLRKSMPDLKVVEVTGAEGKDLIPEAPSEAEIGRRIAFALAQGLKAQEKVERPTKDAQQPTGSGTSSG